MMATKLELSGWLENALYNLERIKSANEFIDGIRIETAIEQIKSVISSLENNERSPVAGEEL